MVHARGFEKALLYGKKEAEYAMEMFLILYALEQEGRKKIFPHSKDINSGLTGHFL